MQALEAQLSVWRGGLRDEVAFWRSWLETKGLSWPEDYNGRFDPQTPVDLFLADIFEKLNQPRVRLLDVGAGPVTNLGWVWSGGVLEMSACDPLAEAYARLLAEAGVTPPVTTQFATAEDLSLFFPRSSFDIVHCRNALDHSFDPLRGLTQMLRVVRVGGVVALRHHCNEAEREDYVGLHQYNIDEEDGRLVFWNRSQRFNPADHVGIRAEFDVRRVVGDVEARITKIGEFPRDDDPASARLREVLRAVIGLMSNEEEPKADVPSQA